MNKLLSRKFLVTLAYALLVVVRDAAGLKISDADLMVLAGVVATYVVTQGWLDSKEPKDA